MKAVTTALSIALAAAALPAAADAGHGSFGRPGDPKKVSRTIEIEGSDAMRYSPSRIRVKRGETVRLVMRNSGKLTHELVLGGTKELKEHAALMRKFPDMEHDEPNMARVAPGERREIVWQFTRAGVAPFACLMPGHMEAGMQGRIEVAN